ncbi:MAG TPA: biotin transporter BioY [Clostridia bacterium]
MISQKESVKVSISLKIALTALMCALTCSGGFIKIPLPMLDVTLQTFFACAAGLFLGKKLGPLSQAIYMLMGLIGIPVFARGGGITYVFQPSFGFILGFILCAFICGFARDWLFKEAYISKIKPTDYLKVLAICLLGILGVYLIGAPYMLSILYFYLKQSQAVIASAASSLPMYFLGDMLSLIVIILAAPMLYKRVPRLLSLR